MQTKTKITSLFLLLSLSLSGCRIPFTEKVFTMPFFEKNSEEVMDLMQENMKKEQNYLSSIDLNLGLLLEANQEKIKNTIPFVNMNSFELDFIYTADGKINGDNIDGDSTIELDLGGMTISTDFAFKQVGDKFFMKVGTLPPPYSILLGDISDQWFYIDEEEIKEKQDLAAEPLGINPGTEDNIFDDEEKQKRIEEELSKILSDTKLLEVSERLPDEKLEGRKAYHYKTKLKKENIGVVFEKIYNLMQKELNSTAPVLMHGLADDDKAREVIEKISKVFKHFEGEVWIDKKDFNLLKSKNNFELDLLQVLDSELLEKSGLNTLEISGELLVNNSAFGSVDEIKEPGDYQSLADYIDKKYLEPAKIKSREARRISDIKQMQTALELYYVDNSEYPDKIVPGESFDPYMAIVPQNPSPSGENCPEGFEYSYKQDENGQNYQLEYCLEEGNFQAQAGINIATNQGIAVDVEEIKAKKDSDSDGILDFEEQNIYNTDPVLPDSDGDGYKDGDEISGGYNPAGDGRLDFSARPELEYFKLEKDLRNKGMVQEYLNRSHISKEFLNEEFGISRGEFDAIYANKTVANQYDKKIKSINYYAKQEIENNSLLLKYKINYVEEEAASDIWGGVEKKQDQVYLTNIDGQWQIDIEKKFKNLKDNNYFEWVGIRNDYKVN